MHQIMGSKMKRLANRAWHVRLLRGGVSSVPGILLNDNANRFIAIPLSLDRLQLLVERCTSDYLRYRLGLTDIVRGEVDGGAGNQAAERPGTEKFASNPSEKATTQPFVTEASSPGPRCSSDGIHLSTSAEPSANAQPASLANFITDFKLGKGHDKATDLPSIPARKPPLPPIQRKDRPPPMKFDSGSGEHVHTLRFGASPGPIIEEVENQAGIETAKSYFKLLEDHINTSFKNAECLNASFLMGRPSYAERARSEGFANTSRKARHEPAPPSASEGFSELDQKTLLLADVAENGSWWTGRPQRLHQSPERTTEKRSMPSSAANHNFSQRSVRINWHEVSRWYDSICNVDQSWRATLRKLFGKLFSKLPREVPQGSDDLIGVESEMKYIRHHFRRVLLKATDDLLKRPGFPCRDINDVRFLLIVLANPLLQIPEPASNIIRTRKPSQTKGKQKDASPRPMMRERGSSEIGTYPFPTKLTRSPTHQWDLVKRVLGLLSNASAHCHNQLVSCFCRYDEERFQSTTDLVAQFVTYRMSRQSAKKPTVDIDPTTHLVPDLSNLTAGSTAQLHAALELGRSSSQKKERNDGIPQLAAYSEDWQLAAAAKVMALLFTANNIYYLKRSANPSKDLSDPDRRILSSDSSVREQQQHKRQKQRPIAHGQLLPTSQFYNSLLDYVDLVADFEAWQSKPMKFTFTQYHFFISIGAKTKLMEYDVRRQMESKARDAFFDNIFRNRNLEQYFQLKVRRNCLIDDSLGRISEVVGAGQEEVKKGLRVQFAGEEGVDAGGLRKEWFLLLVRELFDPSNGT